MPKLGHVSLRVFISKMRRFGFSGPYQEGKHPYMIKGRVTLTIPNPHDGDITPDLLIRLIRQVDISRSRWLSKI